MWNVSVVAVTDEFAQAVAQLNPALDTYVPQLVDVLLVQARRHRASDIHLIPSESGLQVLWRIDGVLHAVAIFDSRIGPQMIARIKVLSGLLTYRTDVPQEGRIAREMQAGEVRVATFPTLYGEKAAVRLFAEASQLRTLGELGLSTEAAQRIRSHLHETAGVIVICGPSGSGKTTTAYACLRELLNEYGHSRSIVTLEDPIEMAIPGISQSQIRPNVGFDLAVGLKSLMRQDPDVIFVGEIRDPQTAETVIQAALTGHLVITTFHAGSAVEAVTRLTDMGIEPYLIRSALRMVIGQRLFRRVAVRSDNLAVQPSAGESLNPSSDGGDGLPEHGKLRAAEKLTDKIGSDPSSYSGRFPLVEILELDEPGVCRAIMDRMDAREIASMAKKAGMSTLQELAQDAVQQGLTTQLEVFRVLGRESR